MPSKRRRGMCGSLLSAFHVAKTTQEHADVFPGEAAARANLEGVYGSGYAFGRKYLDVVKSHHAFFALCSASVFKKALSNKPVPYSLGYGSMLGYERHKSIIPYDNDGDVFVPISFFRIVEDFAVREQNLILDATKKFALLDVEGDSSSGAAPFKVAVTYGGAPIASLDEIFDESQAEHVLFLTDASYKSLVLKPNEDALVTTPTFPEALARAHGTQAFTWGGPLGGRFVMRHKRNPAGMPTSTVLDHPKSFVDHGAVFYSFIDIDGWSAKALDYGSAAACKASVGVTPPNLALADLRQREEEQEELGQSSSEESLLQEVRELGGAARRRSVDIALDVDRFPATVEVAFPDGGSNKVQIFANEEMRKNLVQSCYGAESITTPLFTWNAGAWKKNPTWRPSR
eukprot:g10017.t1